MDAAARLKRGGTVGHLVTASLDDAGGSALDDADGFVEVVEVRRQTTSGLEQAVATAHFEACHEVFVEVVDEACARPGLESRRSAEARHTFFPGNASGLVRHRAALE